MQNTKILDMLNNGQIEELKALIREEIFADELKSKPGAKQRYAAMKKYFSYIDNHGNKIMEMPCEVEVGGEKYVSFTNGCSIALTKEDAGEIKLFENSKDYLNIGKYFSYDGNISEIDFNKLLAKAKSKGYKLNKSEVDQNGDFKYVLYFDGSYYKIGLLDATFGIINDGEKSTVWHKSDEKHSPIIIKSSIGVCLVLPFKYDEEKEGVTILEVE